MRIKLFPLFSTLIILTLFGTAATCNMCGFNLTTPALETKVTSTGESKSSETMSSANQAQETAKVISGFSGIKIMDSNLWTDGIQVYGDPSFMGPLYVNIVEWGAQPMIQSDFDKPGIVLGNGFGSSGAGSIDFTNSGKELTSYLQAAIDAGKDRFQFRIQFTGALSDNDNVADGWRYEQGKVHFWFSYIQ